MRFFELEHVIDLTFHIARLTLRTAVHLVNHDVRVRQGKPFAFRAGTEQYCPHARCHADAIRHHVARQKLHRVVNCQPGRDHAAG